jgi:hypothetical protein
MKLNLNLTAQETDVLVTALSEYTVISMDGCWVQDGYDRAGNEKYKLVKDSSGYQLALQMRRLLKKIQNEINKQHYQKN